MNHGPTFGRFLCLENERHRRRNGSKKFTHGRIPAARKPVADTYQLFGMCGICTAASVVHRTFASRWPLPQFGLYTQQVAVACIRTQPKILLCAVFVIRAFTSRPAVTTMKITALPFSKTDNSCECCAPFISSSLVRFSRNQPNYRCKCLKLRVSRHSQ